MNYFLCSAEVVKQMAPRELSKPFKTGFRWDNTTLYVAKFDGMKAQLYLERNVRSGGVWFFFRQCKTNQLTNIDPDLITLDGIKQIGLFAEIDKQDGVLTLSNLANVIYDLSYKFGCSPVDLINKIS